MSGNMVVRDLVHAKTSILLTFNISNSCVASGFVCVLSCEEGAGHIVSP